MAKLVLTATPASAQFMSRSVNDPAVGEDYFIEGAFGYWLPSADMTIASEGVNIPGSQINLKNDLGLEDDGFPEIRAALRPGRKHKLRFQFIPIKYRQQTVLNRDLVFNGQRYRAGLPVSSLLDWKAFRFAYEYDFVYRSRGFVGLVLDLKYTDVNGELSSVPVGREFTHRRAPVPAIGGIGRYYILPNVSITGELTGIQVPDIDDDYDGHYVDFDLYGTVNVTNNVGAQLGYRSFDIGYKIEGDTGSLKVKGLYFGIIARY
jgi:hypothetical protein